MKDSRYSIGIDLGTTNSTLSYVDTKDSSGDRIRAFSIPQLVDEGIIKDLPALPSFLYLPGEHEILQDALSLPWSRDASFITGEFARLQGTRVPSNLVSSAKSWLCHNRVDREGPILPWGSDRADKISPVEASARFLRYLKDAWNAVIAKGDKGKAFTRQQIIITIPASFDEAARELTVEAARAAGIEDFTMLEEPQAAFYAWIASNRDTWQGKIGSNRLILVFDVGGGTTDFTLISVHMKDGRPSYERVAVGDHILLGGDNMDLTLAKTMEQTMVGPSGRFDFHQWLSATHQCRAAKEALLGSFPPERIPLSILGKGRRVIGGSFTADLTLDAVRSTILEGFFRGAPVSEAIEKRRVSGLQELGLPFESDTAIMKHLSSFLKKHAVNRDLPRVTDPASGLDIVRPEVLLFNGGVFRSPAIRDHAASILREWFTGEGWSLTILENSEFDQAVSMGAAYYGLVLRGRGERISGGAGKAFYISVETAALQPAPGSENPLSLACIVPKGAEEGAELHITEQEFQVMTNRPVSFSLYSSSYRAGDKKGDIITAEKDEFIELPPIRTVLHYGKKSGSVKIPITLGIRINEYGTLDVWCESRTTPHRWKLAFQLRGEAGAVTTPEQRADYDHTLDESSVTATIAVMKTAFQSASSSPAAVTPENVIKEMEKLLAIDRKLWPLFAIRRMWDALMQIKDLRSATAMHESRWLNLAGFLLRPGFGYEMDELRMKELWKIFLGELSFPGNGQCRSEWWILWRRVAGGFDASKQDILYRKIAPWLLPSKKKIKKLSAAEQAEMWMLAASLENLAPSIKAELGSAALGLLGKSKGTAQELYFWALSRLGARIPFHGSIDRVLPRQKAEEWIDVLLQKKWPNPKNAGYTLTQMARKTGDRTRDIDESLRSRIVENLSPYTWADHCITQVRDVVSLDREDEKKIFGESLPVGLYIDSD